MNQPLKAKAAGGGQYDANYQNFQTDLYEEIRREAFGTDIGQNSWLTADEQDTFLDWLNVGPGQTVLDVACGAGGPALRVAALTGCAVVGVDVHEQAVATARSLAARRNLSNLARFEVVDASGRLAFPDARFDSITCIDAINHLPERSRIIAEWARLLKPGGRLLFTDPTVITGPLSNTEISVRSSSGFYVFVPPGYDENVIAQSDLRILVKEDRSLNMAEIAERRNIARASRSSALQKIEGETAYQHQQDFLAVAARIARDKRLSRFVYLAEKIS
jgi:2-polyprenyl-3-methyl-5-hydroxy-6-metoxy-1,4-benzoquinol methylase